MARFVVNFEDRGLSADLQKLKQLIKEVSMLAVELNGKYGIVANEVDSEERNDLQ